MSAGRGNASQRGQASVELVVLAPLLVALVLAVAQLLAAGAASELAVHASQAGATALLQGEDPKSASRAAVPRWSRKRMDVSVRGRSVRVRPHPRIVRWGHEVLAYEPQQAHREKHPSGSKPAAVEQ